VARRRVVEPSAEQLEGEPPVELLRCPWTRWNTEERTPARFGEWLIERQRWRESHAEPLPGLFARDRYALHRFEEASRLDTRVVRAERAAPVRDPDWYERSRAGVPRQ
jgi:hypothetical protein